jgi:TrmH family RNA methyltransferase
MITSLTNPKVKHVRALTRKKERYATQQFVVEGVRLIEEALKARIVPLLVLHTPNIEGDARARPLLERLRAVTSEVFAVSDEVMRAMAATETPPGIAAVTPFVALPLLAQPQFVLILDAVRDPGNVGTILRSARAAGVDAVFFAHGTADPYNDKVVRAAMGAHFAVPLRVASWGMIADALREVPRVYLADARGEMAYARADWSRPVALIVGGEAEGASDDAKKIATARVSIPMHGGVESLNAAMAATVLLFEGKRQRDKG